MVMSLVAIISLLCLLLSACKKQTSDAVDRVMRAVSLLEGHQPRDMNTLTQNDQGVFLEELGEYAILFDGSQHTLDKIKRIAVLAGYEINDSYSVFDASDVKDGFTVYIPWEGRIEAFPIVECKSESAAEQNAEWIDGEGKLVALQYLQFISVCSKEVNENDIGEMLALIIVGDPVFLDTMSMYMPPYDRISDIVAVNERPSSPLDGFMQRGR
jgi:hypothetical protein